MRAYEGISENSRIVDTATSDEDFRTRHHNDTVIIDITDDTPISISKVREALKRNLFGNTEIDIITSLLNKYDNIIQ